MALPVSISVACSGSHLSPSEVSRGSPYYGIGTQTWNEPNLRFLDDTPDGERYIRLFEEAHAARQRVDPSATLAGSETSHHPLLAYYPAVMSRIRRLMAPDDVVSVHYYPDATIDLSTYMKAVAVGAAGLRVWLTETGLGSCDDELQRQYLVSTLEAFLAEGRAWWPKLFVYVLYNGNTCGDALIAPGGTYRPSFLAYRDFVTAHP